VAAGPGGGVAGRDGVAVGVGVGVKKAGVALIPGATNKLVVSSTIARRMTRCRTNISTIEILGQLVRKIISRRKAWGKVLKEAVLEKIKENPFLGNKP
jgi:hypothetical protein